MPQGAHGAGQRQSYYSPRRSRDLLDYVGPRGIIYHRSIGARFAEVLKASGAELLVSIDDGSDGSRTRRRDFVG